MPLLLIQTFPPNSPLVYTPEAMASPPPRTRTHASAAARLASNSKLEDIRLTAADDALFGIYQNWLHQNTGTHLYGMIEEDGKWQER